MSGGYTFASGNYRVVSDLLLTNGTYTLTAGTIFYVDGRATRTPQQVAGHTIIVGDNASLVLDGATITASGGSTGCPMWRGVLVRGFGSGYRVTVQNNSTISHALCALDMGEYDTPVVGTRDYLLDRSTFSNNLTHVHDDAYHDGSVVSRITRCAFDSEAAQMHFPYEEQPMAGVAYYTYQALLLRPQGAFASHAVEVRNNTFTRAVYGIVNNLFDRAGVLIKDNTMNKIFQMGIWTVNNDRNAGTSLPVTSGNQVNLNVYPPQNTDQIDPSSTIFGIVAEQSALGHNAFVGNSVTGDNSSTGTPKTQVGLNIDGQTDASGNTLYALTEGIRTRELDGSDIFDNQLSVCEDGFVVQPSSNGMYQVNRLGCNTFSYPGAANASRGIVVQIDAILNDIGSVSSPAANRFDGVATSIYNDGPPFTYYKTASSQEVVTKNGSGPVTLVTTKIPAGILANYCLNQSATNGNGVNQARGLAPSAGYLAALMDSVRRQLVPPARYRSYMYEVIDYYASNKQLPALETWWATLAAPNASAYRTVGRYLLRAYDAQPTSVVAAQRVLAGLQPAALLNAELAAQLQLRAVLRHLPKTTPRLVAADSVVLRALAWSGTRVAEPAGRWLRYFHPRIALPAPVPAAPRRLVATHKTVLAESGASLGAAYPNPAQTEVTISCQLAQAGQAAELRFTNLLTGQVQLVMPVAGTGTERSQQVRLSGLPAGQYAYQLVVNGQLVAAPQKLLVNP